MIPLAIATYICFAWLILWSIKTMHNDHRAVRHRRTFIARHQHDIRADQLERERRESARIGYRR